MMPKFRRRILILESLKVLAAVFLIGLSFASLSTAETSSNGVTIPSAVTIIDSTSNNWTVTNGVVYENGKPAGYTAEVILLLYYNGIIYQENVARNWWSWKGSWTAAPGDPRGVSPNRTTIPSAAQIIDSHGAVWTVAGGIVYMNGSTASYTTQVSLLLYYHGVIYQENAAKEWRSWNGSAWTLTSDPLAFSGACGSSNGATLASAPTGNLCSAGKATTVSGTGPWSWSCAGSNGGSAASCSASFATVQNGSTMRAYDFYSKLAVNVHMNYARYTPSQVLTMLNFVGIAKVRDNFGDSSFVHLFTPLVSAGIKIHLGWYPDTTYQNLAVADWLAAIKQVDAVNPGHIFGLAGPNESDSVGPGFIYHGLSGIAAANEAQQDIYDAVTTDAQLNYVPVDMWPLANGYNTASTIQVGKMTAYCGRANMHDYYEGDNETGGGNIAVQMQSYLANYRLVCGRQPYVTTESGLQTPWNFDGQGPNIFAKEVNEDTQAKMAIMDWFDHAKDINCQAFAIYDLSDADGGGWGIFRSDFTPKQAATNLRDVLAVLTDTGPLAGTFTPTGLSFTLSGMPPSSYSFVIEKSNGVFDILLWDERGNWNTSNGTEPGLSTSTITINLASPHYGYVYDVIKSGRTPVDTFGSVLQVPLNLNGDPLIIEIH
jgi:hypothetical protein